jgi:hypothetical protein
MIRTTAAITADDVEELRQVIKHLDQVPIGEVIDPARLPGMKAAWGTNAYRAGLALFHGGITDRLPVPYRGLPRPPLSSKPRIAAVMDRFVAERALVLRPAAGNALRERTVPVHDEAAQAIRDLVKLREAQPDQGIFDPDLGRTVRYLFLRNGVLANADYLFASLCVPITSSTSCDQVIFVDQATNVSVFSDTVPVEVDRFG